MRIIWGIVLAAALACGAAQAKDWKKIRIGTEGAYPPFNFVDKSGELQGFDIDIAKAICDKLKAECSFVAQDWDGIIPALLANKYDAIVASMSITDERRQRVAFSDKYYNTPARFVAKKGAKLDATAAGLEGKTVGAQRATTHASYLEDNFKDAEIKLYGTQDEANLDLANGRLDAVLADATVLYEWLEKTDEGKCCAFVSEPIVAPKWFGEGVGVALRKDDKELAAMVNKAIAEIRADGTYEKINKKYFPFSIY